MGISIIELSGLLSNAMYELKTPSVPIIIDDIKNYPDFEMSRCGYFSIEAGDPSSLWTLSLQEAKIPFYLIGLHGIITYLDEARNEFNSPGRIEEFFNKIESDGQLIVDVNDVWLPNKLFGDSKPGMIYRIGLDLFILSYNYRHGIISKSNFLSQTFEYQGQVQYSEEESQAFALWNEREIQLAKEQYEQNQNLALSWENERGINPEGPGLEI